MASGQITRFESLLSKTCQLCYTPGRVVFKVHCTDLGDNPMASTVWKGYLSFGLISIPVRLFAAARTEHVSFHMLHDACKTRIKEQLYCPHCERVVERSEIVKGYEINKGRWIVIEDEEIKKVAPQSSETMEIQEFVKLSDVDPLYFNASYYAVPEEAGRKAYKLMVMTMDKAGYAAIAKVGMHQREYVVIIRPRDNGLTLHTIYYPNEIREVPGYGSTGDVEVKPQEVQLAEQLVKSLAGPFQPERYSDEYQKRLLQLVKAKSQGRAVQGPPERKQAPVVDLMEALKRSLAGTEKAARKSAAQAPSKRAVKHRKVA